MSDIANTVKKFMDKGIQIPSWGSLSKDYEPENHAIVTDRQARKDKFYKDGTKEEASRIAIGLEKLVAKRTAEFMFATPVQRNYSNLGDVQARKDLARAIEAVYKNARIDTENIRRGLAWFASCEVFTIWYLVERPNTLYGFNSRYKLKCKTYTPMEGTGLYPLFDERGDMTAMSFLYQRKDEDGKTTPVLETYTSEKRYVYVHKGGWTLTAEEDIIIGKIPGVYMWRQEPIWEGIQGYRKEIEYALSRNSDIVAYNASPVLKVTGEILGKENKGEARRVFRLSDGGDVSYVSWTQAIEATKYHVDTMLRLTFMTAQIPDLSFDAMKSLGSIGFDARQTLLTDAHLKIGDESGPVLEFLEREGNVIKSFLGVMNPAWAAELDNVEIEHIISPYIQNDEKAKMDLMLKGNGGKPVFSHLESIRMAGYASDPERELEVIKRETAEDAAAQAAQDFGGFASEL